MTEPRLRIVGLHKDFGSGELFAGLDLALEPGEIMVVRGPNGAGKSTLLGCVAGVVVPDAGRVAIDGHDLQADPIAARKVLRYLPQEPVVPAGVTGRELLEILADVHGATAADADSAAASVGIGEALPRLATTYSVGMRRLLALAGLLLGPAGLWVLDEPLAGVDDEGRERIARAVDAACARGVSVLVAGHLAEVSALESRKPRELRLGGNTEASAPGTQ